MKVFVFDLDDTLYEERTYVESGFHAVAHYLQERFHLDPDETLARMRNELETAGRGRVFDQVLEFYGVYSRSAVKECVGIYRGHIPQITLYPDAKRCLERLAGKPVYIVTDGNKHVQLTKLKALGLYGAPFIRHCYITRRFGIRNEKPSPYCFLQIAEREHAIPSDIIYVGDNPHKDFVGIKPLGFRTVRVMRGAHFQVRKPDSYEADRMIDSLDQLEQTIDEMEKGGSGS